MDNAIRIDDTELSIDYRFLFPSFDKSLQRVSTTCELSIVRRLKDHGLISNWQDFSGEN